MKITQSDMKTKNITFCSFFCERILSKIEFLFFREFLPMMFAFDTLYHQIKTPISFWCKWVLNLIFLIKPSKTLLVELTRTHIPKIELYATRERIKMMDGINEM